MRINGWQLSTLLLGLMWAGALFAPNLIGQVFAAPSEVLGSPNIAVTGFKTSGGTYTLWSDGHITDVPSNGSRPKTVNGPTNYVGAPDPIGKPELTGGRPKGSPNVAVGVLPTKAVTYVLFADGTAKIPMDTGAKKGSSESPRVESGVFWGQEMGGQSALSTTSGVKIQIDSTAKPGWGPGYSIAEGYTLTFDPPFENPPIVTVQIIHTTSATPSNVGGAYSYEYNIPLSPVPTPSPPPGTGQPPLNQADMRQWWAENSIVVSPPTASSVKVAAPASVANYRGAAQSFSFIFTAVESADNNSIRRIQ